MDDEKSSQKAASHEPPGKGVRRGLPLAGAARSYFSCLLSPCITGLERLPLLLPAVSWLSGIVFAGVIPVLSLFLLLTLVTLLVAGAITSFRKQNHQGAYAYLLLGFFVLGLFFRQAERSQQQRELDCLQPLLVDGLAPLWTGYLTRDSRLVPDAVTFDLHLQSAESNRQRYPLDCGARVMVYCAGNCEILLNYRAGDRVVIRSELRRPVNYRNPGGFDYRAYLQREGIYLLGALKSHLQLEKLPGRGGSQLQSYAISVRRSFSGFMAQTFKVHGARGARAAGILEGLIFGGNQGIDPALEEKFQETGTYHLFVVSGFNTAIIAVFMTWLLRLIRLPRAITFLLIAVVLLVYMVMADMNLPVVRATGLALLVLLSGFLWRPNHLLNSLAFTVLILTMIWPESIVEASFQLTYLACIAIACLAAPVSREWMNPLRAALSQLFVPNVQLLQRDRPHRWARRLRYELELMVERTKKALGLNQRGASKYLCRVIQGLGELLYYFAALLLVSFSIQLWLAPLMAAYFHRANVLSAFSNLLVVPAMTVLLLSAVSLGGLFWLTHWVWIGWIEATIWFCDRIVGLVEFCARLPYGHWRVVSPPVGWIWLYYSIWLLALIPLTRKCRLLFCMAGLLIFPTFYASPFPLVHQSEAWESWFLDVGHGDSILIISPRGETMLVDGGGKRKFLEEEEEGEESTLKSRFDIGEDVVSPALWALRVRQLDYVILTHPEHDHAGGLAAVVKNFFVRELLVPSPVEKSMELLPHLNRILKEKEIIPQGVSRGDSLTFGGGQWEILNPPNSLLGPHSRLNNRSVVLLGKVGSLSLLLTGDIEKLTEMELVRDGLISQIDILKVAHHGSATSSSAPFLDGVQPRYAVISSGISPNSPKPSPLTLERLREKGARIFQTASMGAIHGIFAKKEAQWESYDKPE